MTRSWWLKAAFFGLLTAAAVVALLPSVLHERDLPAFLRRHPRTMIPAVDVQGGLRFVYEVDVEKDSARLQMLVGEFGMVGSAHGTDGATLKFTEPETRALTERHTNQALERLRGRVGPSCTPTIVEREGNRIVIELPGINPAEEPRIRAVLERP